MIYQINGINVPSNNKTRVILSDLDKKEGTGRTESGIAFRDRIRSGIRQLEVDYTMLTDEQISLVLEALEPEFFVVKYKDPRLGITEKTFYVSDRTAPLEVFVDGISGWDLSFSLIEQ